MNINILNMTAVFLLYNTIAFNFSSKILVEATGKGILKACSIAFNALLLILFVRTADYSFIHFIVVFCTLYAEFSLISKASFRQIFFGASVFMFHIISVYMPTVVIYGFVSGLAPYELFLSLDMRAQIYMFTLMALIVIQLTFMVFVKMDQTIEVSVSANFAKLISLSALISSIITIVINGLLFNLESSISQVAISLATSALLALTFYYIFLYGISFVSLNKAKRESDWVEKEYIEILNKRKSVSDLVSKDILTGLYNRTFINETLDFLCNDDTISFAVIFLDINGLKSVNDSFGHDVGDRLIQAVANGISSTIRDHDYAGRLSGDEFIAIITGIKEGELSGLVERMRYSIVAEGKDKPYPVSASIGAVFVTDSIRKAGVIHMLELSDKLMREDKKEHYDNVGGAYI